MAQTRAGAKKTSATIRAKFGDNFWKNIGAEGGKASKTGGFGSSKIGKDGLTGKERARKVGSIGGKISKRIKNV